jgi:hypothetical protein
MWVNKILFETILVDNKAASVSLSERWGELRASEAQRAMLREQKAKDDMTIDWMRHRVNALEKQNAILLQKAAGVIMPVPEIVPTRPGSMSVPDFNYMPSFEDVGDEVAKQLGIRHDGEGKLADRE